MPAVAEMRRCHPALGNLVSGEGDERKGRKQPQHCDPDRFHEFSRCCGYGLRTMDRRR